MAACMLLPAALALSPTSTAADRAGKFAAVGAGSVSCARFLQAREARSKEYFMLGGWIDGYLTARNQTDPDTFTLTPWQSTDLLAGLLAEYCRKNPDTPLLRAVMIMTEALRPGRLQAASERVTVTVGTERQGFYRDTVARIQGRLIQAGYLKGPASGNFDQATSAALKRFQQAQSITASGFPDQATLFRLLR